MESVIAAIVVAMLVVFLVVLPVMLGIAIISLSTGAVGVFLAKIFKK
jgi:hypothetical protein